MKNLFRLYTTFHGVGQGTDKELYPIYTWKERIMKSPDPRYYEAFNL